MRVKIAGAALCGALCCGSTWAQVDSLDGAWATDSGACSKIFVHERGRLTIASNSDAYGSGFIVEGNRIRGTQIECRIERRNRNEKMITFIAVCSTDIALSTLQFSVRIDGANQITRFFPGMEGMEVPYSRCPIAGSSK